MFLIITPNVLFTNEILLKFLKINVLLCVQSKKKLLGVLFGTKFNKGHLLSKPL